MSTILENIQTLQSIKSDIKNAIINKGGSVTDAFGGYAQAITDLPSGGDTSFEDGIIDGTISGSYTNSRVTYIQPSKFQGYSKLTEIDFPNVSMFGNNAFYNCTGLTTVSLPNCNVIGFNGFGYCSSIRTLTVPTRVLLSNGLSFAKSLSFTQFPSEAVVTVSNALTTSLMSLFGENNKIYSAELPSFSTASIISGDYYGMTGSVVMSNKSLVEVNLPNAWYIDANAFTICTSLTTVSIPELVYIDSPSIGGNYGAFRSTAISSIKLPKCKYIGSSAFLNCSKLTTAIFQKCEYVGDYAFSGCSSLVEIYLPNCSYIGNYAFNRCSNLSEVWLYNVTSVTKLYNSSVFAVCTALTSIIVPASLLSDFQNDSYWSWFSRKLYPYY